MIASTREVCFSGNEQECCRYALLLLWNSRYSSLTKMKKKMAAAIYNYLLYPLNVPLDSSPVPPPSRMNPINRTPADLKTRHKRITIINGGKL